MKKNDFEYDLLFSTLTNIVNSLSEFTNTINIIDECQLTSDGYIQHKKTGKSYILTQAMELGLVSFKDSSQLTELDNSEDHSTLVNDTMSSEMDISQHEEDYNPGQNFFSDTFIFDLLKPTGHSKDEIQKDKIHPTNINQLLSVMNTC